MPFDNDKNDQRDAVAADSQETSTRSHTHPEDINSFKKEFDSLNTKIDNLASSIKSLQLKPTVQASLQPSTTTPLQSIDCQNIEIQHGKFHLF